MAGREQWQQHWDESSGRFYYYNIDTGATSWERPPELESQHLSEPASTPAAEVARMVTDEALKASASSTLPPSHEDLHVRSNSVDEALEKLAITDAAEAVRLGELRSAVQVRRYHRP